MLSLIKKTVFYASKYLGAFHIARYFYRDKIRVLCYHGFAIEDEAKFLPKLFIDPQVFSKRMQYLKDRKYNVLSLQSAIEALKNREQTSDAVVVTIDDGFYGVFLHAAPTLNQKRFPATLYLTSYYFDKDSPIFPLAVKYMLWRSQENYVDIRLLGVSSWQNAAIESKDHAMEIIIEHGQKLDSNEGRVELLRKLGVIVGVDYDELNSSRILGLINAYELEKLVEAGIDIQLHTHRHDFPLDATVANYEIRKNREVVDPLLKEPMCHFCYPSGFWDSLQWEVLDSNHIQSATTCLPGLVNYNTELYAIPRFLDGSNISQIEFEAEMCGFSEFCRKFKLLGRLT